MTTIRRVSILTVAAAALSWAAGPAVNISGEYIEARTADVYTGPCFANSEVQLVGNLAVLGWRIDKGTYDGVPLDGLAVAAAVRASSTLGDVTGTAYPVRAVLMVDERASLSQRQALQSFAQKMSGDLLENIVRVEAVPMEFQVNSGNIHSREVTFTAGSLARIQTRALHNGDHVCTNEAVWYQPLSRLDHPMPAFALDHRYSGPVNEGLRSRWSSPDKRSAFVGTFRLSE
jgi:hypothetical protein